MKNLFYMLSVWTFSLGLFFSVNGFETYLSEDPVDAPMQTGKLIIYPNPATTMINIELNDASFADGIINIKDLAGRKYVVLPVKGRENFIIQLDRRFVPGNYVVDVIKSKNKISRPFSVVE